MKRTTGFFYIGIVILLTGSGLLFWFSVGWKEVAAFTAVLLGIALIIYHFLYQYRQINQKLAQENRAWQQAVNQQQQQTQISLMHRTRQAHTAIEMAQDIAAASELDVLFSLVVYMIQRRFDYYHVQIYTVEEQAVVLQEGTGDVGQRLKEKGHQIALDAAKSLVARAATTGKVVLATDVYHDPHWLPNPLLPETCSEIAVPIKWGDEVIGVLDVQSNQRDGLGQEDELLLVGLCGQIAIAMNNNQMALAQQKSNEALTQYTTELERRNKELEDFAYVASHDLQEPLRIIASYLQLLSRRYDDKLDDDGRRFISYAVDGATRMRDLINDLLSYSRLGTRGLPFAPTDCEEVLQDVLDNLQLVIEENSAVITHDPLPTVKGDTHQLMQLLQNLLSNAVKFHGEESPRIHLTAQRQNGFWQFSVRDNGIGIDPQFFERIFVIFQRLHAKGEYPGTGIGLAICRKIVERHNGRIWVESQPGQGTTFYFTLPAL
jgi:signal transduction histidine kinase